MSQLEVAPPKEGTTDIMCATFSTLPVPYLLVLFRKNQHPAATVVRHTIWWVLSPRQVEQDMQRLGSEQQTHGRGLVYCRRGHVASIHPERDFYVALAPHADWSNAHTAWGYIEDLTAIEAVVKHGYTEMRHAVHGTVMRMLVDPVPFTVELAGADPATSEGDAVSAEDDDPATAEDDSVTVEDSAATVPVLSA